MCAVIALTLLALLSAKPSSFLDFIVTTVVQNDIKAFGMKHRDVTDRPNLSGMITGGNLRSLQNLSNSTKEKLKNSSIGKSLSQAQKNRLRKQFGGELKPAQELNPLNILSSPSPSYKVRLNPSTNAPGTRQLRVDLSP